MFFFLILTYFFLILEKTKEREIIFSIIEIRQGLFRHIYKVVVEYSNVSSFNIRKICQNLCYVQQCKLHLKFERS